jgi:hypothetical protein
MNKHILVLKEAWSVYIMAKGDHGVSLLTAHEAWMENSSEPAHIGLKSDLSCLHNMPQQLVSTGFPW